MFARYSDGTLKQRHSVATGGQGGHQGQPINVVAPPPWLVTRNELTVLLPALTANRSLPSGVHR